MAHFLFSEEAAPEQRIVRRYDQLLEIIESCRKLGMRIVLTSGSWDLTHIGHYRYLAQAKGRGDILIVGVDSDEKIQKKKGPHRPIVHEDERMEVLCHSRAVDIVFLKEEEAERWKLIKSVRPDTLVVVRETYDDATIEKLREFCGEVAILEPQATTSTTARIRNIIVGQVEQIKERLKAVVNDLDKLTGDGG